LGSGAGIPGIPVAAVAENTVSLIEVRRGRAAFLEAAVERLNLRNARVLLGSVERLAGRFDVCLARAFAPLARTWALAERHLEPDGQVIYWAGASFAAADIEALGVRWRVSEQPDLAEFGPLVIMSRQ
jgi:16S rRNA G527 N7-methylase RsmG